MAKLLSTEDKQAQGASLITSRQRLYSDIDLSLEANPNTGDVYKKTDAAAVKQAIKNLLQTNRFEKPFRPDFGADLRGLLFELADTDTSDELEEQIRGSILRYEPRVNLIKLDVDTSLDQNKLDVRIEFSIINTDQNITLETTVSRLR
tara:strand:+ start:12811 stop:13254 length:444 start_codon:yes stop_codon:yes gene_type:complete